MTVTHSLEQQIIQLQQGLSQTCMQQDWQRLAQVDQAIANLLEQLATWPAERVPMARLKQLQLSHAEAQQRLQLAMSETQALIAQTTQRQQGLQAYAAVAKEPD